MEGRAACAGRNACISLLTAQSLSDLDYEGSALATRIAGADHSLCRSLLVNV